MPNLSQTPVPTVEEILRRCEGKALMLALWFRNTTQDLDLDSRIRRPELANTELEYACEELARDLEHIHDALGPAVLNQSVERRGE